MNNENPKNPDSKSSLIDRRFFLKASSATVVATAAGSLIAASIAENQIPAADTDATNIPAVTEGNNETNKQWKAGWMAF